MKITPKPLTVEAIEFMEPQKVKGGWLYQCDGMPTLRGCGAEVVVTRQYVRTGLKNSGWLVCFGTTEVDGPEDPEVGLSFCPDCAEVVLSQ